jgi:hypothetical protein
LVGLLARAGLEVVAQNPPDVLVPVWHAWLITSCGKEDGGRDITVGLDDPDLIRKTNSAWLWIAEETGLLAESRQFFVGIDKAPEGEAAELFWWKVRLAEDWDLVGIGSATRVLGSGYGRPGFVMLSSDGEIIVAGTVWQS